MPVRWLKEKLGITELEKRVNTLESRVDDSLKHFGNYGKRTDKELALMKNQIDDLIAITTTQSAHLETLDEQQKAKQLIKRLKNHQTRINNQLAKIG